MSTYVTRKNTAEGRAETLHRRAVRASKRAGTFYGA